MLGIVNSSCDALFPAYCIIFSPILPHSLSTGFLLLDSCGLVISYDKIVRLACDNFNNTLFLCQWRHEVFDSLFPLAHTLINMFILVLTGWKFCNVSLILQQVSSASNIFPNCLGRCYWLEDSTTIWVKHLQNTGRSYQI